MDEKPTFVSRDGMIADKEYVSWLHDLKERYMRSQVRTVIQTQNEMLTYYWNLGRDIVKKKAESKWGSGFFNQLSLDMKSMFPSDSGFSATNLKYMKRWYAFYNDGAAIRHQDGDGIGILQGDEHDTEIRQQAVDEFGVAYRQQPADELGMPGLFAVVPWGHHIQIITKSSSLDEALFYINKVAAEGWSRSRLEIQMEKQLFLTQGKAVTNFEQTLSSVQSQLAKEILKDPYHFDFLRMKEEYKERDLEDALVSKVTQFLLELGKGFSYVGRQMELKMPGGQTFFPDLIFYHIPQHRYVIIELKAVKYIPEFAGKLNFYVTAADELLRGEGDNPSVGLLICKSTDKTVVEWSLKDINKPLGVSTYQLEEVVARTVAELEQQKESSRK
ncbi:MAG: PDDEXK nuclease domain-containing protein [Bacteroidales bacterium]|nr:PDDEXK nuclease domain-containing protein [Bacteroidales bacterium]